MIRKTLTILSLVALLISVAAWVAQAREPILIYSSGLPDNLLKRPTIQISRLSERNKNLHSQVIHSSLGGIHSVRGSPRGKTQKVTRMIGCAFLADGLLIARIGTETLITDDQDQNSFYSYLEFDRSYHLGSPMYSIPIWSIALVCAIASGLLTILPLHRRRKRKRLGLCLKCGYDLRGSKERCPECGQEFDENRLRAD